MAWLAISAFHADYWRTYLYFAALSASVESCSIEERHCRGNSIWTIVILLLLLTRRHHPSAVFRLLALVVVLIVVLSSGLSFACADLCSNHSQ